MPRPAFPKTLRQFQSDFATEVACQKYLASCRWPDGFTYLRVLQSVGIGHSVRAGRESRFEFDPEPIEGIREYLDFVSEPWDQALFRLKSVVEDCAD